jgi:LmbE family N-acetylglucosaminyl deacetylase
MCFAAHPDDETIGAGGQLPFLKNVWIVHATDGAPRNMVDAHEYGFPTREAYAEARRIELRNALIVAGLGPERSLALGFVDQECRNYLCQLAVKIAALLLDARPETILAPPYEGGHPDHDSVAFGAHLAIKLLAREGFRTPKIIEYALYHGGAGDLQTGDFLPPPDSVIAVKLGGRAAELKKRMIACFTTQRATLAPFQISEERFRPAPNYDFTAPPHPGPLYYERFDWGSTGEEWREAARVAARDLGVSLS